MRTNLRKIIAMILIASMVFTSQGAWSFANAVDDTSVEQTVGSEELDTTCLSVDVVVEEIADLATLSEAEEESCSGDYIDEPENEDESVTHIVRDDDANETSIEESETIVEESETTTIEEIETTIETSTAVVEETVATFSDAKEGEITSFSDDEVIATASSIEEIDETIVLVATTNEAEKIFGTATSSDIKSEIISTDSNIRISTLSIISEFQTLQIATNSLTQKKYFTGGIANSYKAPRLKEKGEGDTNLFGNPDDIPIRYDSREHTNEETGLSYVPPVRQQHAGNCWAYPTIGVMETSIRIKGLAKNERESNLSELAHTYFAYRLKGITNDNRYNGVPGIEGDDYSTYRYPTLVELYNYGNPLTATLPLLTAYMGPVVEDDVVGEQNIDYVMGTVDADNNIIDGHGISDKSYAFNRNKYVSNNIRYINKNDENEIKKAIMENGSVGFGFTIYSVGTNANPCYHKDADGKSYYRSDKTDNWSTNHTAMIVGWDDYIPPDKFWFGWSEDNKQYESSRYGGWLVRNSWGDDSTFMDHGYFYIAYDEPSIEDTLFTLDAIPADTYKYNYHYDTTQHSDDYNPAGYYTVFANVYEVSGEDRLQQLEAVNLGIAKTERQFNLKVYKKNSKMENPEDGTLVYSKDYENQFAGYFTYVLDEPIPLEKGEYFSIVVKPLDNDKPEHLYINYFSMFYDGTFSRNFYWSKSHNEMKAGQSWYKQSNPIINQWFDIGIDEEGEDVVEDGILIQLGASGNKCWRIKALCNAIGNKKRIVNVSLNEEESKMRTKYAINEEFDPTGLVITVDYDNGMKALIPYNKDNAHKFEFSKSGKLTEVYDGEVTFVYNNLSDFTMRYNIKVFDKKITFAAGGGSGTMDPQQFIPGEKTKLNVNTFTKNGYTFNGWIDSNGKVYSDEKEIVFNDEITLTARWKKNSGGSSPPGGGGGGGGGGGANAALPSAVEAPKTTENVSIKPAVVPTINATDVIWKFDPVLSRFTLTINSDSGMKVSGFYTINSVETKAVDNVSTTAMLSKTYYFDAEGQMLTGWVKTVDNNWYFFENEKTVNEGVMATGWKQIQGSWYYFAEDGAMLTNATTPDGRSVGADGKWVQV